MNRHGFSKIEDQSVWICKFYFFQQKTEKYGFIKDFLVEYQTVQLGFFNIFIFLKAQQTNTPGFLKYFCFQGFFNIIYKQR